MNQNGVTDIATAKAIARKLYTTYSLGGQVERSAMEKMMIDTYKIMVLLIIYRIKISGQPLKISEFMQISLILMGMEK